MTTRMLYTDREEPGDAAKLIMCPVPFGQGRYSIGGSPWKYRELREVSAYLYVEDLDVVPGCCLTNNLEEPLPVE